MPVNDEPHPTDNRYHWSSCCGWVDEYHEPMPNQREAPVPEVKVTNKENVPPTRRTCPRCGRLGHLARTCSAQSKSHDKIGIEIEGWWRDLNAAKRVAREYDASGTTDGSLEFIGDDYSAYEFRTRPGSLGEAINQLVALYPDATHPSAGMHVHVSFLDRCDLSVLATGRFLSYHAARWEAWGTRMGVHPDANFWSRLRGYNATYCRINESRTVESMPFNDNRYRQLNFSSFTRHGTLEMRMLPLFRDARIAVSAVEELISIYEDFLRDADALALHDLRKCHEINVEMPSAPGEPVRSELRPVNRDVPFIMDPGVRATVDQQERSVDAPALVANPHLPVAPGHTRLFGRTAATNFVRRSLGLSDQW